jgi:hypothetical protein
MKEWEFDTISYYIGLFCGVVGIMLIYLLTGTI